MARCSHPSARPSCPPLLRHAASLREAARRMSEALQLDAQPPAAQPVATPDVGGPAPWRRAAQQPRAPRLPTRPLRGGSAPPPARRVDREHRAQPRPRPAYRAKVHPCRHLPRARTACCGAYGADGIWKASSTGSSRCRPAAWPRSSASPRDSQADLAAVRVAFSLPWSSSQVQGQINRLKYLKRQAYGCAKLDPLCIRVLHPN